MKNMQSPDLLFRNRRRWSSPGKHSLLFYVKYSVKYQVIRVPPQDWVFQSVSHFPCPNLSALYTLLYTCYWVVLFSSIFSHNEPFQTCESVDRPAGIICCLMNEELTLGYYYVYMQNDWSNLFLLFNDQPFCRHVTRGIQLCRDWGN